jgi:hypothetical protein
MFLDEVARLLPPPEAPFTEDPAIWGGLEALIGRPFPSTYKQFTDCYGPGLVNDHVRFYHPLGVQLNLVREVEELTPYLDQVWREAELDFPFTTGFGIGDVVYWGNSKNRVTLFFLIAEGDPDEWHVIEQADDEYEDSELGFGAWLLRYLQGGGSRGLYVRNPQTRFGEVRQAWYYRE